jgi:hypothetical protein
MPVAGRSEHILEHMDRRGHIGTSDNIEWALKIFTID